MPKPEPIIYLKHLSKKYPIYDRPSQKLLEMLTFRKRQFHRDFWALKDVDLEVDRGTTLGIIGMNGSGKSTLLQIIAGILRQTRGDSYVRGTVSALLELGAGFNPEFTGRENVFMHGAINGLTHAEVEERYPRIAEFAEIGEFIDHPVKTYSSGMFVRLAFAVAIHVDPEILLVDEALAVGDLVFQHRCINRIRQMKREGRTIIFVTHDLQALSQFCDRAILLDRGRKIEDGSPELVVQKYHALIFEKERKAAGADAARIEVPQDDSLPLVNTIPYIHNRFGDKGAEILGIIVNSPEGKVVSETRAGEKLELLVSVLFKEDVESPIIGVTLRDRMGMEVTATNTSYENIPLPRAHKDEVMTVKFEMVVPEIRPGSYTISPAIAQGNIWEHTIEDWIDNAYILNVVESGLVYGFMKWSFNVDFRAFFPDFGAIRKDRD